MALKRLRSPTACAITALWLAVMVLALSGRIPMVQVKRASEFRLRLPDGGIGSLRESPYADDEWTLSMSRGESVTFLGKRVLSLSRPIAGEYLVINEGHIRMRYGNVPDSRTESAFMLLSAGDDRTIELQCNPMPALRIKDRQLRSLLELSLVGSPIRGKSPTTGSTWFYPAPRK
jgi:hypothetical protein